MEKKEFSFNPYIIFAIFMFIIVISAYIWNFNEYKISKKPGDWGTFGDFIGGTLNPTLAFLSFLALLQTIKIQSKELAKSSEALELSKEELAKSSTALEEQSNSLKIQIFETTFFNMINLHNEITKNINIEGLNSYLVVYTKFKEEEDSRLYTKENLKGRESISFLKSLCFNYFCEFNTYKTEDEYYNVKYQLDPTTAIIEKTNQIARTNELYLDFYNTYSNYIGHYFRNIYQIMEFINLSSIDNKKFYIGILKAQLSNDEIEFIFYYAVSNIGSEKLLPILIEYEFFETFNYLEEISKYDILFCIEKTKELDPSYPKNKIFGDNKDWQEYINSLEI